MIRFRAGDRDTGYGLRRLLRIDFFEIFIFDIMIAKYPPESYQPPHVDKVEGYNLRRLCFILRKAEEGGVFIGDGAKKFWRFNYFRPDKIVHSVTEIEGKKSRYVLMLSLFSSNE